MPFTLQQSSDLGIWTDVSTPPVLNYTNLHNEAPAAPVRRPEFYRLKH